MTMTKKVFNKSFKKMLLQNLTQATSCRTKFTKSRIPPQVTLCDGSNVLASFYSIQFIERNDIAPYFRPSGI